MDQHEQDWLDLGSQLKNYEPSSNLADDFADFQQFQQAVRQERRRSGWPKMLSLAGLLLVAILGLGFLFWPGEATYLARPWLLSEVEMQVPAMVDIAGEVALASGSDPIIVSEGATAVSVATKEPEKGVANALAPASITSSAGFATAINSVASPGTNGSRIFASVTPAAQRPVMTALPAEKNSATVPSPVEALSPTPSIAQLPVERNSPPLLPLLPTAPVERLVPPIFVAQPSVSAFSSSSQPLQLSIGAGLSSHWRGAEFMQDVDQGVYASVGVRKDFSSRFGAEIQLGYRDQSLMLPTLGDTKEAYWSHHTAMSTWTDTQGNTHSYEYEGTVEGYRAVELSLMVHYRPLPRIGLSAGGRIALPTLHVERSVSGSDVQNPYKKFVEEQALVRGLDYGMRFGAEYLLNRQLAIQTNLHLGLVDLIEDAGEGVERFNHTNTLSVGLRYSLNLGG
jgi:hypothetical protein